MGSLTKGQILRIVNGYIGVSGGYLGDFSYRTHREFYAQYCGLDDVDPDKFLGTTRERFIQAVSACATPEQAKILRGLVARFPLGSGPPTRTTEFQKELEEWASQLEAASPIVNPDPKVSSEVVARAIKDAQTLLTTQGATSGVDRIHTALHGHLIALCRANNLPCDPQDSLPVLWKVLRRTHPRLQDAGPRADDVAHVLNAIATILNALLPIRNNASVAHPNDFLLKPEEAMLAINVARSLLHYLDAKLGK